MYPERDKFIAKYLGDISKLIFGAGFVMKIFSAGTVNWVQAGLGLIASLGLFIIGLRLHPKE